MRRRFLHMSLVTTVVVVLSLFMSGCLFGGLKNIESLDLGASESVISVGNTLELSAVGTTKTGRKVAVIPEWEIVSGSGVISESRFHASDWDFQGEVVLRATYNKISADITVAVQGLLQGLDPFPQPTSAYFLLPKKTESQIVTIGEPVKDFTELIPYRMINKAGDSKVQGGWLQFVANGVRTIPQFPSREDITFSFFNPNHGILLPEIPRLSHRVHFELIETEVLDRGTNYSRTVAHRTGTTVEQSKELVKRLTSETRAKAEWGWGEIETTLTAEITTRTQQAVRVQKEQTVTKTWSFQHPNDYDTYLYSSWNRVDTFYLSDSKGIPLEDSQIFAGYSFRSYPVEIRGSGVVQRAWGFNY